MAISPRTDVGNQIKAFLGNASDVVATGAPILVIAGGAGDDNTKRTGYSIDRLDSSGGIAMSAKIITTALVAVADTETVSLAHESQDSADDSTFNTAVVIEAATVKFTSAGGDAGANINDEHILDLSAFERYFRINVTIDFSAADTDTGLYCTTVILGGFSTTPVS